MLVERGTHVCLHMGVGIQGVTEVIQHLCSLGICTVLELTHKFTRLNEYSHVSLNGGDMFREMRRHAISSSCKCHRVYLRKP